MFGNNSSGFANEIEIINYLNTTKFDNLNTNFKDFLSFLFNENLTGKTISACKPKGQVKPDIAITIDKAIKYVSLKKGGQNSVHQEQLSKFESFLSSSNVPEQTINYLKEFHYGDGSMNGSGNIRISAAEWINQNSQKASKINNDLNVDNILMKSFDRFLFVGNIPNAPIVDAMYHGNIQNGLWANKNEIKNYLLNTTNSSNNIHFSNLTYQTWNRNLKHNPNTEARRHVMQIKWTSLAKDFENITKVRDKSGKK